MHLLDLKYCVPAVGRHHAFSPRFGWPAKAHAALRTDPLVFTRSDAPVALGVGSSMVGPMRFWSRAFGLIHEARRTRPRLAYPTPRGHWLLDDDGADPYLENPGTLWLLHRWLLRAQPRWAQTFYHLFANWWQWRFTRSELRTAVQDAAAATGWPRPGDALVGRDITALVSMYGSSSSPAGTARAIEDS